MFNVHVFTRIIAIDEQDDDAFLILLDENGDIPKFILSNNSSIDEQLHNFLLKFINDSEIPIILSTKTTSSIINKEDILSIFYNLISNRSIPKSGKFVKFNKKNLELYRLVNGNR